MLLADLTAEKLKLLQQLEQSEGEQQQLASQVVASLAEKEAMTQTLEVLKAAMTNVGSKVVISLSLKRQSKLTSSSRFPMRKLDLNQWAAESSIPGQTQL